MKHLKQFFLLLTTTIIAQPMHAAAADTIETLPEPLPIARSKSGPSGYPSAPAPSLKRNFQRQLFLNPPIIREVPTTSSSPCSESGTSGDGLDLPTPKQPTSRLLYLLSVSNTPRSTSGVSTASSGTPAESPQVKQVQSPVNFSVVFHESLLRRSRAGFQSPKTFGFKKQMARAFFSSQQEQ